MINYFNGFGQLLYARSNNENSKTVQALLLVGTKKSTKDALVQPVNKIVVRILRRAVDRIGGMDALQPNAYYAFEGHVNPIERRNLADKRTHYVSEIIIRDIRPMRVRKDIEKQRSRSDLQADWFGHGVIRKVLPGRKETSPYRMLFQVRQRIEKDKDDKRSRRGSALVNITVHRRHLERLSEFSERDTLSVRGRLAGVLRRLPGDMPGEWRQEVSNEIVFAFGQQLGVEEDWIDLPYLASDKDDQEQDGSATNTETTNDDDERIVVPSEQQGAVE